MRRVGRLAAWAVVLLGVAWSSAALPDDSTPENKQPDAGEVPASRADALRMQGNAAMDSGRPADALWAYDLAFQLSKDPALFYNRGRALQALTRYPEALQSLERFGREAPDELKRRVPGLDQLLTELAERVATLRISTAVASARVRINDRVIGTTPLVGDLKVNAGPTLVEAEAEGYLPYSKRLNLPGAAITTLKIPLVVKERRGLLRIRATEPRAVVRVDGVSHGITPVDVLSPSGMHTVMVTKEGYLDISSSTFVAPGQTKDLVFSLQAEPGLVSKWWFWTAAGTAIVGAVATILLLNTERSPDSGSIPPGQHPVWN